MEKQNVRKLGGTRACSGEGAQEARRVPGILRGFLELFMKPFQQQGEEEIGVLGVPQLM